MGEYTLEHWRDGEILEKVELTASMFKQRKNGTIVVKMPPGSITLATEDELHFKPEIKELL